MMTMPPTTPAMRPSETRPNIQARPIAMMPRTARDWPNGPRMKVQILLIIVAGLAPPETV